jgi:hypothetical protein
MKKIETNSFANTTMLALLMPSHIILHNFMQNCIVMLAMLCCAVQCIATYYAITMLFMALHGKNILQSSLTLSPTNSNQPSAHYTISLWLWCWIHRLHGRGIAKGRDAVSNLIFKVFYHRLVNKSKGNRHYLAWCCYFHNEKFHISCS